ncbi:helix-turn-helix transcriptional regulator [Propionibacteriaceae bacterium Y2011]|uniref:helix-turn-helix transcriptional regulator n=1 Tax=Microlunatus sp. Y2014 TaxID=3418488 RepID=UPI003B4AA393
MGNIVRQRRVSMGLTQAELAARLGVDVRQIRRYEANTTEPTLQGARRLADLLDVSLDELAGSSVDHSGTWWSAWHGSGSDAQLGELVLIRRGSLFDVSAAPSPSDAQQGGTWRGELRPVDDDALLGWFVRDDAPRHGTLALQASGSLLHGPWLAMDSPAGLSSGIVVLGREAQPTVDHARNLARSLRARSDRP